MTEVRKATTADVAGLAAIFARAFFDDPLMTWVLPDEASRQNRLRRFWHYGLARIVSQGLRDVYCTTDLAGGAMWAPPRSWKLPVHKMLPGVPRMLHAIGLRSFVRIARADTFLASSHPSEDHWYLDAIAVDPSSQQCGIGSALMYPVLQQCDRDGLPAYLETSNDHNVAFYSRHGFDVITEVSVPARGPHMWQMWRKATAGVEPA